LKAEDGMLFPAPSVNAAAALTKYASTVTCVRPGFKTHAVVAVTFVLPALVALPVASVKFTALADKETVSDSANWAFNAIGCAPEFSDCAEANNAENNTTLAKIAKLSLWFVLLFKLPPYWFIVARRFARGETGAIMEATAATQKLQK
jgi:hypothetical protein